MLRFEKTKKKSQTTQISNKSNLKQIKSQTNQISNNSTNFFQKKSQKKKKLVAEEELKQQIQTRISQLQKAQGFNQQN